MSVAPPVPAAPGKTLVLKTDWLGAAITVAETVESAAELIPFPYVKGVAAVIVHLLRAIEQLKKNHEDLKELCDSCTELTSFLRSQIVQYGNTAAIEIKSVYSSAHFTNIFLVDASKPETIDNVLKNIAISKGFGNSASEALKWFQSKHENWLLFFDNADDPHLDLNKFIPKCTHGNILITSRNPGVRVYGSHSLVSDMEEVDAISLLLRSADKEDSETNVEIAAEIVKELCYLPLAIVQAGAFISESEDLDGYLALYHKNRARLLSKQVPQSHDNYAWTVYTTWQISFDRLSKPAATLLQLCSFLHYTGISEDMFSNASKYSFPLWRPSKEELKEPLEFLSHFKGPTGEWDSLCFLTVTNQIKAYSLISFDANTRMFSIHPLVHDWSRSTLANEGAYLTCMSSIVGMAIAVVPETNIQQTSLKLVPHLSSLKPVDLTGGNDFLTEFWRVYQYGVRPQEAQNIAEKMLRKRKLLFAGEHEATLEAMACLASTYYVLGEYKRAEELQTVVLEKWTKLLGKDHPNTVQAMGYLAFTYHSLGEYKRAEELQSAVLEKRTNLLGEDHPDTVPRRVQERAEKLQTMVLEKRTKLFGKDHLHTVVAMGELASTYRSLGEYKRAEKLHTTVLEKRTKLFGKDHLHTVVAMGELASTYRSLGEYKRAEKLHTTVLEKQTKLWGKDHLHTVAAREALVSTYRSLGEYKRAEELGIMVLEKRTQVLGEDHPDTVVAMGNLAVTYHSLGEYKRAEELQTMVLEKYTKLLGKDHPDTVLAMGELASTYHSLGEYKRAEEVQTVVLEQRTKVWGKDHPDTVLAMGSLASTYRYLGEYKRAEELQTMVLEKYTKLLGKDHPDTVLAMGELASTYHSLREYKRAEEVQTVVLERQTKLLGKDHPHTVVTMEELASTYYSLGENKRAEELQITVLDKWTKLLGEDHPDTVLAMGNLAVMYHNLGEYKRAKELETVVLEKRTKLLGEDHPDTVLAMGHLASTYYSLGEYKRAEELQTVVLGKQRNMLGDRHPDTKKFRLSFSTSLAHRR
ncbi:hypothetical protein C8R46DRAFT_1267779 [Mycena filopes]|nr:hypothetical protein C8R46DRAFT_1267779 [Mycena filopes]